MLAAYADRMENVCVMRRATGGVCSDTHLCRHPHTHTESNVQCEEHEEKPCSILDGCS